MQNQRLMLFFHNLQQDIKAFLYFNGLFMLFRVLFLLVFSSQLSDTVSSDIQEALWYGLRISLKTAGAIALVGALFSTIPNIFVSFWPAERIRKVWNSICIIFFTFTFVARIPYYKIFNSSYNMMLLNGAKDDWQAIYATAVSQYQLWPRLAAVIILAGALIFFFTRFLKMKTWQPQKHQKRIAFALIFLLPILSVMVRFGGSYSYANSIHWENAAKMNANILNEAILDDGQALYRSYSTYKRLQKATNVNITSSELKEKIALLRGQSEAAGLEEAFVKKAQGARLKQQPQNIVMLFGENYALWPFLPKYESLNLVEYGKKFAVSEKAAEITQFLPNGNGTMPSLEGVITGLPDASLYANYQPETFKSFYAGGIGNLMKKLGYKTCFWYGGFGSWQNIEKFVLAQGFDEFHGADELKAVGGNAWGVSDEELFDGIANYMKANREQKTFHFILTTSNHPPFTIDVDSKGFEREKIAKQLPDTINGDKATLDQLGHIWYADQMMGKFVEKTEKIYPDTLFVLTGDHAERFSFAKEESLQANFTVPCVFYGKGVDKDWFAKKTTGIHLQIIPTLVEIIAPPDFEYTSILPSFFDDHTDSGFNSRLWMKDGKIGMLHNLEQSDLDMEQIKYFENISDAAQLVAAWRVKKGNQIK